MPGAAWYGRSSDRALRLRTSLSTHRLPHHPAHTTHCACLPAPEALWGGSGRCGSPRPKALHGSGQAQATRAHSGIYDPKTQGRGKRHAGPAQAMSVLRDTPTKFGHNTRLPFRHRRSFRLPPPLAHAVGTSAFPTFAAPFAACGGTLGCTAGRVDGVGLHVGHAACSGASTRAACAGQPTLDRPRCVCQCVGQGRRDPSGGGSPRGGSLLAESAV